MDFHILESANRLDQSHGHCQQIKKNRVDRCIKPVLAAPQSSISKDWGDHAEHDMLP